MSFGQHQRRRVQTPIEGPSMTEQAHKDQCDIYKILKQYQRTGVITHITRHQPVFEDLPDAMDLQEAMEIMQRSEEAFETLPASVRERYGNDPVRFLADLHNPAKADELRELGVLKPLPKPEAPEPSSGAPPA